MEESTTVQTANGTYQVGRVLGEGAFGVVRLGSDAQGKQFAIKCLLRSFLKKQREFVKQGSGRPKVKTALEDVKREIAIMKKTHHPNLVGFVEAVDDENEDKIYIVLEFITGGQTMYFDGKTKAYSRRPSGDVYDEQLALKLFREMVEGLRYLHAQNIIHRDIKPENLLLTAEGTLKIADFGIAQRLEVEPNKSATASPQQMQGTHQFMSPEMITGEKNYNGFKVDIWAAGVCLFIFVHGNLPFWGTGQEELFESITKKDVVITANVSNAFQDLLRGVLDKNANTRLSLADVVQQSILQFGKVEDVHVMEVTEEEKEKAFTPTINFKTAVKVILIKEKWLKSTSSRSNKTFSSTDSADTSASSVENSPVVAARPALEAHIEMSEQSITDAHHPVPPPSPPSSAAPSKTAKVEVPVIKEEEKKEGNSAASSEPTPPVVSATIASPKPANSCCLIS